jgi:2-dehydro-3-deoxyglucarate aldolase/4-hydroxy-2-oxoheptanedioate aldolase
MRDNPVKRTLAAGGTAAGAMVFEFFCPTADLRECGIDFVLFDMEHTGLGFETLKTQGAVPACPSADGAGAAGGYRFGAGLDVGALGVMVPMVAPKRHGRRFLHALSPCRAPRRGVRFLTR